MSGRTGRARNVQSGTTKVSEKSLEKDKLLSAGGREQWVERGKKSKNKQDTQQWKETKR